MRGDSRLDLYAKSLAVLLLGLLGLAGAMVDYWPAPTKLPLTAHPSIVPLTPSVQTAFLPGFVALPVELVWQDVTAPVRTARAAAPVGRKPAVPETAPQVAEIGVASPVQTLGESLPSVPIEAELTALPSPPMEFSASAELSVVDPASRLGPALGVATEPADDGFFSGVLKKTGSSVGSSLGKASNSLVGAVRVVGDAVKKAF